MVLRTSQVVCQKVFPATDCKGDWIYQHSGGCLTSHNEAPQNEETTVLACMIDVCLEQVLKLRTTCTGMSSVKHLPDSLKENTGCPYVPSATG